MCPVADQNLPSADGFYLQLTEANHDDNQFYDLGRLMVEGPARAFFASLPDSKHDCDNNNVCYLIDLMQDDPWGCVDSHEVTAKVAEQLLGRSLVDARDADRALLAAAGFLGGDA